ncbi:MAG: PAS domain S-box protein [Gemmatimonadales bacterium]
MKESVLDEKSRPSWTQGRRISQPGSPVAAPAISVDERDSSRAKDYADDLVFIVKEDGTILYLNQRGSGVTDADLSGTSIYSYTAKENQSALRESVAKVFASGEAQGYECRGTGPFDPELLYQCRVAANKRDGRVVSATIIARDITALRQSEVRLRTERDRLERQITEVAAQMREVQQKLADKDSQQAELQRFRNMIDQAGEAIFITDPKTGRFVDANATACAWLGRSREDVMSLKIDDIDLEFPLGSPNGSAEHVTDTRDSDRPKIYSDGRHRRRNGTSFPVEVAIARRNCGGDDFMLAVARDIKERRRAEEALRESESKFRSLFELSRDAIYLSARDGTISDVNEAAMELFGYTRAEFIGLEAKRLYANVEDIRRFQQGVTESGTVRNLEVEFRAKDGASVPGLLSATLRHSGDGSILGYQCIIRPRTVTEVLGEVGDSDPADGAVALPRAAERQSVLVVDEEKHVLAEVKTVLERAGIPVLAARTGAAGVEVLKAQAGSIAAVLIGLRAGENGSSAIVEGFRQTDPGLHIVLLRRESDTSATDQFDSNGLDVIVKPIHPLALVQHVRDALVANSI